MKVAVVFWVLFPFFIYGQESSILPFKDANKIIVKNEWTGRQNLYLLHTALLNKGYTVITNYRDQTIMTNDSLIENGTASYKLNAFVGGDSIVLTGSFKGNVISSILGEEKLFSYDIAYSGFRGSLSRKMFGLLEDIAKDLKGHIIYVKEKKRKRGFIF